MGCRAFLTPDTVGLNPDGSHKYYGRFNQGAVTINLVDVSDDFYREFDDKDQEEYIQRWMEEKKTC